MKRIMVMMGSQNEAIKLCPVVLELKKRGSYEVFVCSAGQYHTGSRDVLAELSIRSDFHMEVMWEGEKVADATARILQYTDGLLKEIHPDMVLVQGDTATAFAAGVATFYRGVPLGHVEAGVRSYHIRSPFPNEFHRQAVSLIADYHFAPTVTAKRNLIREGKPEANIFITGNTVVDALRITLGRPCPQKVWNTPKDARLLVFTARQLENNSRPLRNMMRALRRIVSTHPDLYAVFPICPDPKVRAAAQELLSDMPRVCLIDSPDFVTFHHLLSHAYLILTDSAGIQETCCALGIPTLVMRYSSENSEGMRAGVLKLVGCDEEGIVSVANRLLMPNSEEYTAMHRPSSVFGNGNASSKIVDILQKDL